MSLSQEIDIKLCPTVYKIIVVIKSTEPRDQILQGHWWKFWSHDTDVTRQKSVISIKS